jgi:hypothetical protein
MPSQKKKATAKAAVKFKDLTSKKNPKGGWSGSQGGDMKISGVNLKIG